MERQAAAVQAIILAQAADSLESVVDILEQALQAATQLVCQIQISVATPLPILHTVSMLSPLQRVETTTISRKVTTTTIAAILPTLRQVS